MKRAILLLTTLAALTATGCETLRHHGACNRCPQPGHAGLRQGRFLHGGAGPHGAGLLTEGGPHGAGGYLGRRGPGTPDYIPKLPPHHGKHVQQGPPGPPAPSYVYPYYTTRGPRDFLMDNPPSIGR